MNTRPRPAPVHYYVDADLLGLAKILVQMMPNVTYPGDPGGSVKGGRARAACTITDPATLDEVWIPETARQEWLIITRDRHIQDHRAEIEAVRSSGARMVNLAGDDAKDRCLPPQPLHHQMTVTSRQSLQRAGLAPARRRLVRHPARFP